MLSREQQLMLMMSLFPVLTLFYGLFYRCTQFSQLLNLEVQVYPVKLIESSSEVSISASLSSKILFPQSSHCKTHRCIQHLSSTIVITTSNHCIQSHVITS